jgi:hypothetical protein
MGKYGRVVDLQHRFRDFRNQTQFYYQQRYNALDSESTKTVHEDLIEFQEDHNSFFSKQTPGIISIKGIAG